VSAGNAAASVVICSYSRVRRDLLLAAAASLRRQTVQPREVVVVVDHNPELLESVTKALPDALVVPNRQARGLSGSRNSGTLACRAEVVAFLDDDAVAAPDWLERLLAGYTKPEVAGVGGRVDGVWEAGRPRWFPPEFDWVVGCSYLGLPTTAVSVRNLLGCNMSFRRALLVEAGGFRDGFGRDGSLPLGCEETELCIRLQQRWPGCVVLYQPAAVVRHHVPGQRSRPRYFGHRCFSEGRSKAQVTRAVGSSDGLASERAYVRSTLPRGIGRELAACMTSRSVGGLGQAAAIASGLLLTAAGYGTGLLYQTRRRRGRPVEQPQGAPG